MKDYSSWKRPKTPEDYKKAREAILSEKTDTFRVFAENFLRLGITKAFFENTHPLEANPTDLKDKLMDTEFDEVGRKIANFLLTLDTGSWWMLYEAEQISDKLGDKSPLIEGFTLLDNMTLEESISNIPQDERQIDSAIRNMCLNLAVYEEQFGSEAVDFAFIE